MVKPRAKTTLVSTLQWVPKDQPWTFWISTETNHLTEHFFTVMIHHPKGEISLFASKAHLAWMNKAACFQVKTTSCAKACQVSREPSRSSLYSSGQTKATITLPRFWCKDRFFLTRSHWYSPTIQTWYLWVPDLKGFSFSKSKNFKEWPEQVNSKWLKSLKSRDWDIWITIESYVNRESETLLHHTLCQCFLLIVGRVTLT